jgi:hypothetical protein
MKKKHIDEMTAWVKFWDMKYLSGMVIDHPKVSDDDQYLSQYDVEQMLNKRSGKLSNGCHIKMGKMGRKCTR